MARIGGTGHCGSSDCLNRFRAFFCPVLNAEFNCCGNRCSSRSRRGHRRHCRRPAAKAEGGPLSHQLHRWLTYARLDVQLMEARQIKGAPKAMPSRRIVKTRKMSRAYFIWVGFAGSLQVVLGARVLHQPESAQGGSEASIALETSFRRLPGNFGFKSGTILRGLFELRIRELIEGVRLSEVVT